jgi:hypothetical protein
MLWMTQHLLLAPSRSVDRFALACQLAETRPDHKMSKVYPALEYVPTPSAFLSLDKECRNSARTFGFAMEDPACGIHCQGNRAEGYAEALPDSPFGGLGALRAAAYDADLQSSKLRRQGPRSVSMTAYSTVSIATFERLRNSIPCNNVMLSGRWV